MYIMYVLNYPCNDSTYFMHIVSVNKYSLIDENKFVGKFMSSLLGVHASYNKNINTFAFGSYHHVVDIDNKKIIYREAPTMSIYDREESSKIIKIDNYVKNILKERNVNSQFLKNPLVKLKTSLENFMQEKSKHFNNNQKNTNFVNFLKDEIKNIPINGQIIRYFFDFNLTIMSRFYRDNQLDTSFDKIINDESSNFSDPMLNSSLCCEEEKLFLNFYRNSVKYRIYFDNFLKDFEVMDVFRIPFLLSEIFLEMKIKDPKRINCYNIDYFNIFEHLYRITTDKKEITKKINFEDFHNLYFEKMKKCFNKINLDDVQFQNSEISKNTKNNINMINLNRKTINRYIYLLANYFDKSDLDMIFSSKKDNEIKEINREEILIIIKNKFIENKFFSSEDFLVYALVYIISLTIIFMPYNKMINSFIDIQKSFEHVKYFLREFLYIIIKSIYKYYLINKETKNYPSMTISYVKMYLCLLGNYIRQKFICPNEEIMTIFKLFFTNIIYQERQEIIDRNIKDNDSSIENIDEIYKSKNYLIINKYCFTKSKMYKSGEIVNRGMKEFTNTILGLNVKNRTLTPKIEIKLKDYIFSSNVFSPLKMFQDSEKIYNDFFEKNNLNISTLNIRPIREIIVNLIFYGKELKNRSFPIAYLMNTLYILKDFETQFQKK